MVAPSPLFCRDRERDRDERERDRERECDRERGRDRDRERGRDFIIFACLISLSIISCVMCDGEAVRFFEPERDRDLDLDFEPFFETECDRERPRGGIVDDLRGSSKVTNTIIRA